MTRFTLRCPSSAARPCPLPDPAQHSPAPLRRLQELMHAYPKKKGGIELFIKRYAEGAGGVFLGVHQCVDDAVGVCHAVLLSSAERLRPCCGARTCCGGAALGDAARGLRPMSSSSRRPYGALACGGGGGGWHEAMVLVCLPLAAPIGLSSERVSVVSTEPPDDLSCLTTPGVGRPGDGAVARAVDQGHPDAHSESVRGFANSSTDLCALECASAGSFS